MTRSPAPADHHAAHEPVRGAGGRVRNTRQAAAIEEVLKEQDGFRSAQQLYATIAAGGEKVGLTTVYRYLNALADQGRADVVHSADGEAQFRLCGADGVDDGSGTEAVGHHHHVVCRVCGRSVEVSGPEVEAWAERVAAAAGYTEITHTLEVFGLCPTHSARSTTRRRRPPSTPAAKK